MEDVKIKITIKSLLFHLLVWGSVMTSPLILSYFFNIYLHGLLVLFIVIISAPMVFLILKTLLFNRYGLIINRDGIIDNTTLLASPGFVSWDQVVKVKENEEEFKEDFAGMGADVAKHIDSVGPYPNESIIEGAVTQVLTENSSRYLLIQVKDPDVIINQKRFINRFFLKGNFNSFETPFIIDTGILVGIGKEELAKIITERNNI